MNMPDFNAENSLYKTSGQYQSGAGVGSLASRNPSANAVQAAAAIYGDGRFVCNGEVTAMASSIVSRPEAVGRAIAAGRYVRHVATFRA